MLKSLVLMIFLIFSTSVFSQENSSDELIEQLFRAVSSNNVEVTSLALEKGLDINSHNQRGHTALMTAGIYEALDVFIFLLDNGANLYLKDGADQTILTIAERNEIPSVVELIKDYIVDTEFYNGKISHFLEEEGLYERVYQPIPKQEDIGADRLEYSRKFLKS